MATLLLALGLAGKEAHDLPRDTALLLDLLQEVMLTSGRTLPARPAQTLSG